MTAITVNSEIIPALLIISFIAGNGFILLLIKIFGNKEKIDGEIRISETERGTVWDIQTDHPEKIEEANGQIVQFKIVKESDNS